MFSNRANQVTPSATVELNAKVAQLIQNGIDVVKLNIGEPDFTTPENIKRAAEKAIEENFTRYTAVSGIVGLRKIISDKLEHDNNIRYSEDEICVTTGAKQALFEAGLVLLQDGDEALIPTPCWVSYEDIVKIAGAVPIPVTTKTEGEERFHLDFSMLEQAVTERTKVIIINTPNNPTGVVYSREELDHLAEFAKKHNLWIISDEVYEKLIYDDAEHISIASISDDARSRTVTVNGCSKTYAMTGWRIGYAAAPRMFIKKMQGLQGHITSGVNSISQKAACEAIAGPQDSVEKMRRQFALRQKLMYKRLNEIPGINCPCAEGAFYLLPDVSYYFEKEWNNKKIANSSTMAKYLLEEARIAVVPGESFRAPSCVRISYSNSMENLTRGLDQMEQALNKLR